MTFGEPDPMQPAIMLSDTANTGALHVISLYSAGVVTFRWTLATALGATRAEREATLAAVTSAAGRRA
jgi:hypothetical protein